MNKFKNISISIGNYVRLKELGYAGDSFNDVLTDILDKINIRPSGAYRTERASVISDMTSQEES